MKTSWYLDLICFSSKELCKPFLFTMIVIIIIGHFFSFYIFFYTQQDFVFYFLIYICNVHNHIVPFFSSSCLERIWYLSVTFFFCFFLSLFIIFIIFSWWIFRNFYICQKCFTRKSLEDIKLLQVKFIMIYIIHKKLVL